MTIVAAVLGMTAAQAQSSVIALLSHEGNVTTFNGATALQKAHEAAVNGDVITLSSGTFHAVETTTKGVTVRGAGMLPDTELGTEPTVISGNFNINMTDAGEAAALSFEGVQFNSNFIRTQYANNVTFNKCIIRSIGQGDNGSYSYRTDVANNLTFIHCRVWGGAYCPPNGNITGKNCYFGVTSAYDDSSSNFDLDNCIVASTAPSDLKTSIIKNSIVLNKFESYSNSNLGKTTAVSYTLGTAYWSEDGAGWLGQAVSSTCWSFSKDDFAQIFKTYTGTYDNYETFELTDDAAAKYLGSDGKQVGLYGGSTPYTPTPSISGLQVTKFQVAPKSDGEGKLSIDIEVKTAE